MHLPIVITLLLCTHVKVAAANEACDVGIAKAPALLQRSKASSTSLEAGNVSNVLPAYWMHVPKCGSTFAIASAFLPGACSDDSKVLIRGAAAAAEAVKDQENKSHALTHNISILLSPSLCPGLSSITAMHLGPDHRGIDDIYDSDVKKHGFIMLRQPEQRIISAFNDGFHSWPMNKFNRDPENLPEFATAVAGCSVKMLTRSGTSAKKGRNDTVCGSEPATLEETQLALQRIREGFPFIGLTEQWDLSICLLHAQFGGECDPLEFEGFDASRNSTASLYDTTDLQGFVDEQDGLIYEEAKRIFNQRLTEYDVSESTCKPCFDKASGLLQADSAVSGALLRQVEEDRPRVPLLEVAVSEQVWTLVSLLVMLLFARHWRFDPLVALAQQVKGATASGSNSSSRQDAVKTWTPRSLPQSQTVVGLIDEQAAKIPDHPFVDCWSPDGGIVCTMTFADFSKAVRRASAILYEHGVRKDYNVGVLSHGSISFYVYVMACIKLGAVPVMISWKQSDSIKSQMVKLAKCSHLLVSKHFAPDVPKLVEDVPSLCLEEIDVKEPSSMNVPYPTLEKHDVAAILFTSGSTGTPKGAPRTHEALMWNCEQNLLNKSAAFPEGSTAGTVCFLPNFHAIGFHLNFIFNLYCGIRASVLQDPHCHPVTPDLLLKACADLRPAMLHTVPWIIEAFCSSLRGGEASVKVLGDLHHVAFGGAQLPPACEKTMKDHGITLHVDFGQTELGGPVLKGQMGGSTSLMQPQPGVTYTLKDPISGKIDQKSGELVLFGAKSVSKEYIKGSNGRALTAPGKSTIEEYWSGDIFEEVELADGSKWIRHCSRHDDLLVHTSGEMTNPLLMEKALMRCPHIERCCILGNNLPRCALVLELKEGKQTQDLPKQQLAEELWWAIDEVNETQPEWSHILAQHTIVYSNGFKLPVSVKGEVQRNLLNQKMQSTLTWLLCDMSEPDIEEQVAARWLQDNLKIQTDTFDSLAKTNGNNRAPAELGYFYFFCIYGVCVHHWLNQIVVQQHLGVDHTMGIKQMAELMKFVSLQGFSLYAGYQDLLKQPEPKDLLNLLVFVVAGYMFHCANGPSSWFFNFLLWAKLFSILSYKISSPAWRLSLRVMFGVAMHFISPTLGNPDMHDTWSIERFDPFPRRSRGGQLYLYYFSFAPLVPRLLPLLKAPKAAVPVALAFACLTYAAVERFTEMADLSSVEYDFTFQNAMMDAGGTLISAALTLFIVALLPKTQSIVSDAGAMSAFVYLLSEPRFGVMFFTAAFGVTVDLTKGTGTLLGCSDVITTVLANLACLLLLALIVIFLALGITPLVSSKHQGIWTTVAFVTVLFLQAYILGMLLHPHTTSNIVASLK